MEAGKKYRHGTTTEKISGKPHVTVYTCHAIMPSGRAAVSWVDHFGLQGDCILTKNELKNYVEYVEPKKGTVWVGIYEGAKGPYPCSFTDKNQMTKSPRFIACVEVPWTEGEGLDW